MKCDISNNMTYALLFATAVTVTMIAKTTAFTSNAKANYRTVYPEAAK